MGDTSKTINCGRHGTSYVTYLCGHVVQGQGLGFVQSDTEGDDPRPDAWCNECDRILLEEGDWNEKSRAFANIQVLCANCYDEVRRKNLTVVDGKDNGINTVWFLDNVLDRHQGNPNTFQIPSTEARQGLEIGDQAKLVFVLPVQDGTDEVQGERMWVTVAGKDHLGYTGTLLSTPYIQGTISRGEKVLFGPEHILEVRQASKQLFYSHEKDIIVDVESNFNRPGSSEENGH